MKISAGILLYKIVNGNLFVFLVHPGGPFWKNKDIGSWSIPKGEVEEGDNFFAVAKRELFEETGIKLEVSEDEFVFLDEVRQKSGKKVYCWGFEKGFNGDIDCSSFVEVKTEEGILRFPEIDKGEFFDFETAEKRIIPAQYEFVERLSKKLGIKKESQAKLF